jgi:hypothetical protein
MINLLFISTPLFAAQGPIPDNVTHFKMEQTSYFHVYNQALEPGMESTFDVTLSKDKEHWHIHWAAAPKNDSFVRKDSEGDFTYKPLKNGAFELHGHASTITLHKDGKKTVEKFNHYDKSFYPIPNSKTDYKTIACLRSKQGELLTTGHVHFVFSDD